LNDLPNTLGGFRFVEAFSLILVSELGDKTFFVAGLFAMKTNK
jgi:putative Ca2+/H+ antiporter (TMEM165/GDT1 family)